MARPKKDENDRKTVMIKIRVTAEEKELLEKMADNCGYASVSSYIRGMIYRDNSPEYGDYIQYFE